MSDNLRDNEMLKELIRYMNNKMSNEERYDFEKALERDPFLAEAYDGMTEFKSSDIEKDLHAIDLISGKSKRRINPIIYWSAAASVLIIVASVFLFNKPQNDQTILIIANEETDTEEAVDSFLFAERSDSLKPTEIDSGRILIAEVKELPVRERKVIAEPRIVEQKIIDKNPESAKNVEVIDEIQMAAMQVSDDMEIEDQKSSSSKSISIDSGASRQSLTGAVSQIQKNEEAGDVEISIKRMGLNADPQPLGGENLFNTYLDKNIIYPVSEENITRKVVKLSFIVSEMGIPSNFTIIRAPENEDFSNEAIRLITEGPGWSPAIKDGLPIEDEVVLRIVFKP